LASTARVHILAVAAFLAIALAFTWPLPEHAATHLVGNPAGDAGVYVWNLWAFRYEVQHGHSPFRTGLLFVPDRQGTPLVLHNYTVFADLLALPLLGALGLVLTFNVVYWLISAANAYVMFLLARHLTRDDAASFLAALAFGFSPFLITRGIEHFSLATAAALPALLLCLLKAQERRSARWAIGAGLCLVWAIFSDAYYGMYGLLMGAYMLSASVLEVSSAERTASTRRLALRRVAGVLAIVSGLVVLGIALTGGGEWVVGGKKLVARSLYTPVLIFLGLVALTAWLSPRRPRVSWRRDVDWRGGLRLLAVTGVAGFVACLPLLHAFYRSVASGRYVQPDVEWRSSPPGADLLAFFLPNPNHAGWESEWLAARPNGFVENVASQSLVALAVIGLAVCTNRRVLPRIWVGFTVFFVLLALGPFIQVGGATTGAPTPWAVLRYVPLLANARSPTRFVAVATLGVAILFAYALKAVLQRAAFGPWLALPIAAAMLWELAPADRCLYEVRFPSVYAQIAADARPVSVLELPFGVRSGASNAGDFSAYSMFCQTVHGKPLLGGYLSRVPDERVELYRANPMTDALLHISSGQNLSPEAAQAARDARKAFLRDTQLGYVVIDKRRWSERSQRFIVNALHLDEVGGDAPYDLYAVPDPKLDAAD
jgi:hypothetical protein